MECINPINTRCHKTNLSNNSNKGITLYVSAWRVFHNQVPRNATIDGSQSHAAVCAKLACAPLTARSDSTNDRGAVTLYHTAGSIRCLACPLQMQPASTSCAQHPATTHNALPGAELIVHLMHRCLKPEQRSLWRTSTSTWEKSAASSVTVSVGTQPNTQNSEHLL